MVVGLIILAYLSFNFSFSSNCINFIKKSIGCLSTSILMLYLSAYVGNTLTHVYPVDFGK
jgi:hypothetical protein